MIKINELFNLEHTLAKDYLLKFTYGFEVVPAIKDIIFSLQKELPRYEYEEAEEGVFVHKEALVAPTAYINGPAIIGRNTEIRHSAFIRGSALIGEGCVIGNSTEIKNSILFDKVQVPHFNYIGDSILGYKSHLGAGAITSNVKSDRTKIKNTGLKKLGALVGDCSEIGCNSVLNPGAIIEKNCIVYPLSSVRGVVEENSIYKNATTIIKKEQNYG